MATIKYGCAVVVHGGVDEPLHYADGCESAAAAALRRLGPGHDAIEAAALDGETINMDPDVMDSRGTLGAIPSIKCVKNPVLVARDVARSLHVDLPCDDAIARFDRDIAVRQMLEQTHAPGESIRP